MPLETQDNFTQGLNDRLPPYKIPEEAVQEALDCDFSYGDVRGIADLGSSGGGKEFFYESGNTWIGRTGVGGQADYPIQTYTTDTTVSADTTYGTPITAAQNVTVTLSVGITLTAADEVYGLATAQSFVEYNEDLYVSRDDRQVTISSVSNNSLTVNVGTSIYDFVVGDQIIGVCFSDGTQVDEIDIPNQTITLSVPTIASGTNVLTIIKCVPVRFIDGDVTQVYSLGLSKPNIGITVGQLIGTNANWANAYSASWYTSNYPVSFQYGIARYDDPTGAEGVISDLSDASQSRDAIKATKTNLPATVEFNRKKKIPDSQVTDTSGSAIAFNITSHGLITGDRVQFTSATNMPSPMTEGTSYYAIVVDQENINVATSYANAIAGTTVNADGVTAALGDITIHFGSPKDGKYAVYRTGGTSSILKKVCNLYYKNDFYITSVDASTACLDIEPVNFPSGAALKAYFYVTDGTTLYSEGHTYVAASASLTGSVEYDESDNTFHISKQGTGSHKVVVVVTCTFPDTEDDREYILTGDTGASLHASGTDYYLHHLIDATPARSLIDIQPVEEGGEPPRGLRHLTEVNDFFFGAVNKRVHVSSYGRPNVWPLDGFIDFDSNVTALRRRGGELVVFTDNGIYRVYGSAHNTMRKVKVPTVEGVKEGLYRCIVPIRDGLIYVSHSGISIFNGRDVEVLTQLRLGEFELPSNTLSENTAGVVEDVFYLLGPSGDGYTADLRFGTLKLSRCGLRADNLHYRGLENKLYTESGEVGGGSSRPFTFRTRAFTGGDINREKLLRSFRLTGFNFSGKVELYADSKLIESYTIDTVPELNRGIYPSTSIIGNIFSVRFIDCRGRLQTVSLDLIPIDKSQLTRFDSITFSYIGQPTVGVKVDNVTSISSVQLTNPGVGNTSTATLYFPAMEEGYIAHVIAKETEENRIMSYDIAGEAI
jgi:hypothetical protein